MAQQNPSPSIIQGALKFVDTSGPFPVYYLSLVSLLKNIDPQYPITKCEKVKEEIWCYSAPISGSPPIRHTQFKVVLSQLDIEKMLNSELISVVNWKSESDDVLIGLTEVKGKETESEKSEREVRW